MSNPRSDITDEQYEALLQQGLSPSTIRYLKPSAVEKRLAAPPAPVQTTAPAPDTTVSRLPAESSISAQQDFVQRFMGDEEKQKQAVEAVENISGVQFAQGRDEPSPFMDFFQGVVSGPESRTSPAGLVARGQVSPETVGGLDRLKASLIPQTVDSPQVGRDRQMRELQAEREAQRQMAVRRERGLYNFRPNSQAEQDELANRTKGLLLGEIPTGSAGERFDAMDTNFVEEIADKLKAAGTMRGLDGSMIESPLGYAGRLLSAPTSAAVGLAEAALTDKDVSETVPARITEGLGFIAGGADLGNAAADALDLDEDSWARTALVGGGGAIGLVGELISPLDLGVGKAARAVSTTSKTQALAKSLNIATAPTDYLYKAGRNSLNGRLVDAIADTDEVKDAATKYARMVYGFEGREGLSIVEDVIGPVVRAREELAAAGVIPQSAAKSDDAFLDMLGRDRRVADSVKAEGNVEASEIADLLAYKAAQRQLHAKTAALGKGSEAGRSVRVTGDLVASRSDAAKIMSEFQTTLRGRMARKLRTSPAKYITDGKVDLQALYTEVRLDAAKATGKRVEAVTLEDIGVRPVKGEPSDAAGVSVREDLQGRAPKSLIERGEWQPSLGISFADGTSSKVRIKDWNASVGKQFEEAALANPGVRRLGGARPERIPGTEKTIEVMLPTEMKATDGQVRKVLKPVEVRPNILRKQLEKTAPAKWLAAKLDPDNFEGLPAMMRPVVKEIGERWNGLDLDFMAKWRAAKKEKGLNHADAYAQTIVDAYDGPKSFVYDALMNAHGGFESVSDVMNFGDGSRILNLLGGSTPGTIRRKVSTLLRAADDGALGTSDLAVALKAALGAPDAQSAVTRTARVLEMLEEAGEGALKKLVSESGNDDLIKLWGDFDAKLLFGRSQATDLFSMSYAQRQLETIVEDVVLGYAPGKRGVRVPEGGPVGAKDGERMMDELSTQAARIGLDLSASQRGAILERALATRAARRKAIDDTATPVEGVPVLPRAANRTFDTAASLKSIVPEASPEQLEALWAVAMASTLQRQGIGKAQARYARELGEYIKITSQSRMPVGELLNNLPIDTASRELLLRGLNLKQFTKVVDDVVRRVTGTELSKADRLLRFMTGIVDDGTLARFAKGGILSGVLLPTFRYMGMNVLTAPAIIQQTVGTGAAARSLLFSPDAMKAAKTVYRGDKAGEVLFTAPNGTIYTRGAVADMLRRVQSQVGAELRGDMFDAWKAYSETQAKGDILKPRGALANPRRLGFKMTGVSGATKNVVPSFWAEVADATDYYFRAGVLVDALKAGRAPDEALALAREALLDYSKVSQAEKNTINKIAWFWSFRRENLRTSARAMLDNPARFRAQYQLANNGFDYDNRAAEHTRDYTETRPFIKLINDNKTQQRYATMGPALPLLDGTAELLDHMSTFLLIADTAGYVATGESISGRGGTEVGTNVKERSLEGAQRIADKAFSIGADNLNPLLTVAIGGFTDTVGSFGEFRSVGSYIDPRLLAYIGSDENANAVFHGLIKIEPIPFDKERAGGGSFQGRQWRVAPESKAAYTWLMTAMLLTGTQRMVRDYAPVVARLRDQEQTKGHDSAVDELLFQSGLSTPVNLPSTRDRQIENERAIIRMLNDAQR